MNGRKLLYKVLGMPVGLPFNTTYIHMLSETRFYDENTMET